MELMDGKKQDGNLIWDEQIAEENMGKKLG
jgi:hypothetical protein